MRGTISRKTEQDPERCGGLTFSSESLCYMVERGAFRSAFSILHMTTGAQYILLAIIVLVLGALGVYFLWQQNGGSLDDPDTVFCAQDVRQCPNGSFVSRVPPSCNFAACPNATSTATSTRGAGANIDVRY